MSGHWVDPDGHRAPPARPWEAGIDMSRPYLNEIRYSHLEDLRCVAATLQYDIPAPGTSFEQQVQTALAAARNYHLEDELGLALDGYQQLQALILKTVNPQLPSGVSRHSTWRTLVTAGLTDLLLSTTANALSRTPISLPDLPPSVINPDPVPDDVAKMLAPFASIGSSAGINGGVGALAQRAAVAAGEEDWTSAVGLYKSALQLVGQDHPELQGYLTHDLGVLTLRSGDLATAGTLLQQSATIFSTAAVPEGQVASLSMLADVLGRQGQTDAATKMSAQAVSVAQRSGLGSLSVAATRSVPSDVIDLADGVRTSPILVGSRLSSGVSLHTLPTLPTQLPHQIPVAAGIETNAEPAPPSGQGAGIPLQDAPPPDAAAPVALGGAELLTLQHLDRSAKTSSLTLLSGAAAPLTVTLDGNKTANLADFYSQLQATSDVSLVQIQRMPPMIFAAYIPYVYFFILPMSIADVYASMGNYADAETEFLTALQYRYINPQFEVTKVWTRLAETYLAEADAAYRAAGEDGTAIATVAAKYAQVVAADGSVPTTSPLYAQAPFASFVARAQAILAAADPLSLDDNPQIIRLLVQARLRQQQIAAGLNFFGFPPAYVPPFSFTYLQNTARYFAQHAATLEQSYIQFKSQAENEDFRLQQIEQQVELARASVDLEQRGVQEAQAGVAVAGASVNYASQQLANAHTAQNDFSNTRWELLELAGLEAWSQAAAQDEDDEVHQTISGYSYYNVSDTRRSLVVQQLETKRTLISQEIEADRLAGEVASAQAYLGVAQAQLQQAQAAVATAAQRVVVAQLQQRQAEDSRDFLSMKEFGARLWYELARSMRGLYETYLDSAIQIAALMERAYAAETGRDLRKIRFDYRNVATDNLLGSDTLLRDIDYFTLDLITTTRTKKAPLKVTMSLADLYPTAFSGLVSTGVASFETTLEQFDRMYPGFYLHKVRNVELVLVGVSNGAGIHGTLRNIGVSTFRDAAGAVQQLVYPADVMPLSDFEIRQDIVIFQPAGDVLRLFENNGLATMWRLELPLGVNEIDLNQLIDVQVVLSFDAFFDAGLETTVRAGLPTTGTASKATSMRVLAPDELFYLRQQGNGQLPFGVADFPRTQTARARTASTLRLTGPASLIGGLVLRITPTGGAEMRVTTAADGTVAGAGAGDPLGALIGGDPATPLTISVAAADNPSKPASGTTVDLTALTDVQLLQEYSFSYR
jgi:hypothetical protein